MRVPTRIKKSNYQHLIIGVDLSGFWPFILGLLAASFFRPGAWGAIYAYTAELIPAEARGTGMEYAGGIGKVAAVIGASLAGALIAQARFLVVTPLAIAFALGGMVVFAYARETRG